MRSCSVWGYVAAPRPVRGRLRSGRWASSRPDLFSRSVPGKFTIIADREVVAAGGAECPAVKCWVASVGFGQSQTHRRHHPALLMHVGPAHWPHKPLGPFPGRKYDVPFLHPGGRVNLAVVRRYWRSISECGFFHYHSPFLSQPQCLRHAPRPPEP